MIRLRSITLAATSAFIATVAFAGCGSDGGSGLPNGGPGGNPGNGDPGTGGDVRGGGKGDGGGGGNIGDVANCAGTTAESQLLRVNLITMFDKSGSMGVWYDQDNHKHDDTAQRWTPVTAGMDAFFTDPQSKGMSASLQYFPSNSNSCSTDSYSSTSVSLVSLPSDQFGTSMKSTTPSGGTPTRVALEGAIAFARTTSASHPNEKSVVLLVTDGEPNNCSSSVSSVSAVAAEGYNGNPSIPTYVIGVGPETDPAQGGTFNQVAASGGTGQAIHVDVGDPAKTTSDLIAQLNKIRGQVMSCSFPIPPAPDKREINYDAVRVNFTNGAGQATTLKYNETCAGDDGWHYNVKPSATTKPSSISLCSKTCGMIQGDLNGKINIAFDCKGSGGGPIH